MQEKITIEQTLSKLIEEKKYPTIKDILVTMNPMDIASVLQNTDSADMTKLFRLLPKETAAECFVEMEPDYQEELISCFSDKELTEVINELYVDDAADLVEEMPANVVKRILSNTKEGFRKEINEILKYPENSAGSIMTTEYVSLRPDMTIKEALERIKKTAIDKETIYTCYVTEKRMLLGVVTVKDLIIAKDDEEKIKNIMETNVICATTLTDREETSQMLRKYGFLALPIVDGDNRMVGIVTFDDAMDVIIDEVSEDIGIISGMSTSEKSYLHTSAFELFLHRIPWLLLLMVSATFTGLIISSFEDALTKVAVLTAFIPMLMDTGGNSGSQASVTIIRALSLGEIKFSDLPRVIFKEFSASILCAAAISVACFAKIMLIDHLLLGNDSINVIVALCVCASMALTVIVAKFIGCALPMIAKKLKFDPAVMASPFITTIVDAISLLVYFAFANAILF
ncbi:MAG: magnesium transporter [Clostridia bacterium]|nr:magnesium transporter [Clostridia bacterium]